MPAANGVDFFEPLNPALPVDEAGDGVVGSLRRGDDRRAIVEGNVAQLERNVMAFQDVPDRDAERRPGKLNERKHGVYMTEAGGNFNVGKKPEMNRQSKSAIACMSG